MTNAQIIAVESQKLAQEGIINFTGRTLEFVLDDEDKTVITYRETEPIHTYAHWKTLGFQVKKGEKAVAQFMIWKHSKHTKKNEDGEEKDDSKMFLKLSSFFKESQVDKIDIAK